jgi:hypothetical protein
MIVIQQTRGDGNIIPLRRVPSGEHFDSFSVTGVRSMQSKTSKSTKSLLKGPKSLKKGPKSLKKGPKFSKSTKGKGGKGSDAPTISPSPTITPLPSAATAAPTCLECDDVSLTRINHLFNFDGRNGGPDTVPKVVFGSSLLVLMGCICLFVIRHRSTHQKKLGKGNSVNAAECFRDGLDEDTVVEDDWTVENALSWPQERF